MKTATANKHYRLYGLSLKSAMPLRCALRNGSTQADTEMVRVPPSYFARVYREAGSVPAATRCFHYAALPDRSTYLRWTGLFELAVSADGRRIAYRTLNGTSREVFQTYLLSQVLSFVLIKRGIEPWHATTVAVDGGAAAFMGDCGYGKSSLGAAFLRAGHTLLTDDVLAVTEKDRRFIVQPGPPRIKLFPDTAKAFLGDRATGTPMNPSTPKLVIPLPARLFSHAALPLRAVYVLRPPGPGAPDSRVTLQCLSQRRACLELIANTFNAVVMEPGRLSRQFDLAARLAATVPVKSLSYPRDIGRLPSVVEAIQADLTP